MLKLEKLNKYFNKGKRNQIHIINNTTLEFNEPGIVVLLGASGSGKTTLLNVIGGLDKANKGKIYINGHKITKMTPTHKIDKIRNLNIGYIFQDYKLIENYSVFDNVAISLKMIGIKDKKEIAKRVNYVLESVDMYRYRNRPAQMLSGGERQRVAIARAIVKSPNIIIADEPTGNLDSKNSLEIMNIIKAISKDKLVILVTHEVELAKFYASRIIEIQDGKIINDYENEISDSLEYRLDNKIYLKDLKNTENINKENCKIEVFTEKNENIDVKLVAKNGNIYIEANNKKVEVVDEDSPIELINDHYKKIDKSIYEKYNYNLDDIISKKKKLKYSSINGFLKSIINGFKKISSYTVMKKILLIGYFLSAMFIVYSISSIFGTRQIKDEDFITKNPNYLQVESGKIDIEDYLEYEKQEDVEYILPGDSLITLKMNFKEYYQTADAYLMINGSLTDINAIMQEELLCGKMPEKDSEVVIDKMVIDKIDTIGYSNGYSSADNTVLIDLGIKDTEDLLGKALSIDNVEDFTIVGITDKKSPSIYMKKDNFINILHNTQKNNYSTNIFNSNQENQIADTIMDYSLYLDDITLKKGKLPENDYEVIVNIINKDKIKLNETIDNKVNGKKLKVVGYYESKTDMQNYFVNSNTIKYNVINNNNSFMIYTKNKEEVLDTFRNEYGLDIVDTYEKDKQSYIKEREDEVISNIIFAIIVLSISLIEIFLMIRSSFLSRIKEIGILRAIGVKKSDIYKMFIGEIFAITTLTSLPGIILMSYILNTLINSINIGKAFIMNWNIAGLSIIVVYLFNLLVGLMPLYSVIGDTPAKIFARHDIE